LLVIVVVVSLNGLLPWWSVCVACREAELDAVVGQYGVNFVGNDGDQGHEEG
jgi:hypothetical protein